MELDEYKAIVRKRPVSLLMGHVITERDINIKKQSRSVISKIKKSLQMEMMLAGLFIFLISFILFRLQNFYLEAFGWTTAVICLCLTFYIFRLYRKIIYYQATTISVKKNLEQIITILEQFTKLYFILTLIMVPLILTAAIFLGYASIESFAKTSINPYSIQQLVALTGLCFAWYIAMYFFTKWYLKKLYGQHLTALKEQLKELEDE